MKYLKALLGIGIYRVSLCCVWFAYVNYFKIDVVFYSALWAAGISLIIQISIVNVLPVFVNLSRLENFSI